MDVPSYFFLKIGTVLQGSPYMMLFTTGRSVLVTSRYADSPIGSSPHPLDNNTLILENGGIYRSNILQKNRLPGFLFSSEYNVLLPEAEDMRLPAYKPR
jgi:hypothetical protein